MRQWHRERFPIAGREEYDPQPYAAAQPPGAETPDDTVNGSGAGDALSGTAGNDLLNGLGGDDTLTGGAGNDTADGGAGDDTAAFGGALAGYSFSLDGSGRFVVSDTNTGNGNDGIDTLIGIEHAAFSGSTLALFQYRETQVNTYTPSYQAAPAIATLADGGYVVTWISDGQDGSGVGVYQQRYDADGAPAGVESRVNTTTANDQTIPAIAAMADGGYLVVWQSDNQDGSGFGIYAQRYAANGATSGSEFKVNTTTTDNQGSPSIASFPDGSFVIAWDSMGQDGSDTGLYLQRYAANGATVGAETLVNTYTEGGQGGSSIAPLVNGGFVIVWTSNGQDGSGLGVYAQRFGANGVPVGTEFQVNITTFGWQFGPAIAGLADGGFVITWVHDGAGLFAQRYDVFGAPVGDEVAVSTSFDVTYGAYSPDVVSLADGGYLITWQGGADAPGGGWGILERRFAADGTPLGDDVRVNTTTADTQERPVAAALPDGGHVIAWASNLQDGASYGIELQRMSPVSDSFVRLRGDTGANLLDWNGAEGADLLGAGGNDTLEGGAGNNLLDGGAGDDTARFDGALAGYTFGIDRNGNVVVKDIDGGDGDDGTDLLVAVENATFADASVSRTPLYSEFLVNTYTPNSQIFVDVAELADGDSVVVWRSSGLESNAPSLYLQRYDALGVPIGGETRVSASLSLWYDRASIAALADGGYVVASQTYDFFTGEMEIFARRFAADGTPVGSEHQVNTHTAGNQTECAVAALADGGYVITWESEAQDGSGTGIYAQRYDASGATVGAETRINTFTANDQIRPEIVGLDDGGYLVSWSWNRQGGFLWDVEAQRFNASGTPVGGEIRVNTYVQNEQMFPSIATLADGGWVIAWGSGGQDGYHSGVYFQRYDANGVAVGPETQANTFTDYSQILPEVAALSDGGFVVSWQSLFQDSGSDGIYARRFDANGVAASAEFRVNTQVPDYQINQAITALSGGGFLVAWESNLQDGSNFGIYAQRYFADGDTAGLRGDGAGNRIAWDDPDSARLLGAAGDDTLVGGEAADALHGEDGNDSLDGGPGRDLLHGGAGNDVFVVDSGDVVNEGPGAGTDLVYAASSWTLAQNVENLVLTGASAVNGAGNALANQLSGNSADNLLDGAGGVDTLVGGAGNDTYLVDGAGETVSENPGEGSDTVRSAAAFTLGADVENLVLIGNAAVDGTGNALANNLGGNAAANALDGLAGADTLSGEDGDDDYTVDNAGDVLSEQVGAGDDSVNSSLSWTLGANFENLRLTGVAGTSASGNPLANRLTGNSGNNALNGLGGVDTLIGGAGSDSYVVDTDGESVVEGFNEGNDTVSSSASFVLGPNLEVLLLTGSGNTNGTGNSIGNTITGNSGSNTLIGLSGNDTLNGGGSADALIGGGGNDTYVVDAADVLTEEAGDGIDTVQCSVSWTLGTSFENAQLTGSGTINAIGNALANQLTGNSGANLLDGGAGVDTLIGGGGTDTYVIDALGETVFESLNEGSADKVQSAVTFTLGANIEQLELVGSTDIHGFGNSLANTLTGNSGANWLDGGTGVDSLLGGGGDDTYVIDSASDAITENAASGTDTVRSSIAYTLGAHLEALVLTGVVGRAGTGNAGANSLSGNGGADTLRGENGNDTLEGGAGADSLAGGAGNDLYRVDAGDVLTELSGEGTDTVESAGSWTLGAFFDRLVLTGSADVDASGNTGANAVTGNSGDNGLDGGAGADTLAGGAGDDTYTVDAEDTVTELADAGTDTVVSALAFTLGAHLENLVLTGAALADATGNALANELSGNSAANVLDGRAGADTLTGGAGSDTYYFDDDGDLALESLNQGADTVRSARAITSLGNNLEHLVLLGTTAIQGVGNGLGNQLTGNVLGNLLDGGAGADTLTGQKGDDSYVVDNALDTVVERIGEGVDIVLASVDFTLPANVEELKLEGVGAIDGRGNARSNYLEGNDAANVLDGGISDDLLAGLGGNDTYVIDFAEDVVLEEPGEGIDTIQSSVSYTLPDNVENLELTGGAAIDGTGNALANAITGNNSANALAGLQGNDTLTGNVGADTLDGGAGADAMTGGAGDDTYAVDNVGDAVTELAASGSDLVQSTIAYTLGAEVEHLLLQGVGNIAGTGNALSNQLIGNDGNNLLRGLEGDDLLKGGDTLDGTSGTDTLVGGTGDDLYYVDSAGDVVTELADGGTDTVYTIFDGYTLPNQVENVVYFDPNVLFVTGNGLNNFFTGNDADNTLDGAGGADTLAGAGGDDTYIVESAGDTVIETAGQGTDTVEASLSYTLTGNVENLTLAGAAASGTGNALDNTLAGTSANNTLDGGAGVDTLAGGAGDDTYVIGAGADSVQEAGGEGTDTVLASVNVALGENVENALLQGVDNLSAQGNALDNLLGSNFGNNVLVGGAGIDTASYASAAGAVSVDLSLATAQSTGAGGTDVLLEIENLDGSAYADALSGSAEANVLDGGAGIDTMAGGDGDDTYYVDDEADEVIEEPDAALRLHEAEPGPSAGTNIDTVIAQVSYTLRVNIENLLLAGTQHLSGNGNAGNNILTGNTGNNTLSGLGGIDLIAGGAGNDTLDGGAGADTLNGGAGNDTYLIDSVNDEIRPEASGGGTDTVRSAVSLTLGTNLEMLILASGAQNGTGNAGANTLTGNGLANVLQGQGGSDSLAGSAGADRLIGGTGRDTLSGGGDVDRFVFDTAPATDNIDLITDFKPGTDKILLDKSIFTAITQGASTPLADAAFYASSGSSAHDASDRILYNSSTGGLFYDPDGNGAAAPVRFATIGSTTHPVLTAADFVVIG